MLTAQTDAIRRTESREDFVRTVGVMDAARRMAFQEEVPEMEDLHQTEQTALSGLHDRVEKVHRLIVAAETVCRVAAAVLAVAAAIAEEAARRRIDSEDSLPQLRALLQKPAAKIWKRNGKKKREGSARRRINAPEKTSFMKRKNPSRTNPDVLSNLRRKKKKPLKK